MTHMDLVKRGAKWLRNTLHCGVVLEEHVAYTYFGEIPDVVGWVGGKCILVECKTSVSDYLADQKKPHRKYQHEGAPGIGHYRFYLTPEGLLSGVELPEGWGWYEARGKRICYAGGCKYANCGQPPKESCQNSEIALLYSALRQQQLNGGVTNGN